MSQKPKFIQITSSSTNIQAHNYAVFMRFMRTAMSGFSNQIHGSTKKAFGSLYPPSENSCIIGMD